MVEINDLSEKVFSLLKGNGLQIKIFDESGAETTDPTQGRRFFVLKPNLMVTIDDENNQIEFSKGSDVDDSILPLQKNIRKLADQFLMNSNIKIFGKTIQPKDYAYQAKMNKGDTVMENTPTRPVNHLLVGKIIKMIKNSAGQLSETDIIAGLSSADRSEVRPVLNRLVQSGELTVSFNQFDEPMYSISIEEAVMESFSRMFGSQKTSRQTLENVKILVRHKTPVDENVRGARSRHISAIFLECNGERMRFPHNYLPGARAMAQHMAHGGQITDKVGNYISESTGQLLKLQAFNRYVTTNKLINEDSSDVVETVKENIQVLKDELKKLTGSRTYETVKARLETFEREQLSEDDTTQLKELFTIRRFDEKFEEVLPIVKQMVNEKDAYRRRIEEAASGVIYLKKSSSISVPVLEFASENAKLGYKINELALCITENDELANFISKVGNKICKEGAVNDFEKAILTQVFENSITEKQPAENKELKESLDLTTYFDRFDYNFL